VFVVAEGTSRSGCPRNCPQGQPTDPGAIEEVRGRTGGKPAIFRRSAIARKAPGPPLGVPAIHGFAAATGICCRHHPRLRHRARRSQRASPAEQALQALAPVEPSPLSNLPYAPNNPIPGTGNAPE
jgi:hypothetical protein